MFRAIELADLLRFVEGECSPDEAAAMQEWIAADPRRGALLDEVRAVWRLTGSTTRPWAVTEARLRLLRGRGRHAAQGSRGWLARLRAGVWAARVAAAIACLVASAVVWRLRPRVAPFREYATAAGQQLQLTLSDSSRVLLGVGTRLRVPLDYGERERAVDLDGEAYFVVRHDSHHPFVVRSRHGLTEDLGTSFDVRAYAHEPFVQVVVAAGRVALRRYPGAGTTLTLRPRDRGVIDARGLLRATSGVVVSDYLAWLRGTLVFDDAPLRDVVVQFARWYDVDVQVTDPSLRGARVTIAFTSRSADEALTALARVLGARWTRSGRSVRLLSLGLRR